jgi:hypothetical protein
VSCFGEEVRQEARHVIIVIIMIIIIGISDIRSFFQGAGGEKRLLGLVLFLQSVDISCTITTL